MLEPTAWCAIADTVSAEDFYRNDHRLIFEAIAAVVRGEKPVDIVTLSEQLERTGKLVVAGGLAYLGTLARDTPSAANCHSYAQIIRERSRLRALNELAGEISSAATSDRSQAIIARSEARLAALRAPSDGASTIPLRWFGEARLQLAPTTVAGLIGESALVLIYGESGTGKSTFALDLELAIARSIPWRGLGVRGGLVVHVAGEGAHGVEQRLLAYAKRHTLSTSEDVPFAVVPSAVPLLDPLAVTRLIETLRVIASEHGGVRLVSFDTLARCLSPGDENDGADMGAAIVLCDRIRAEIGCTVVLIHHAGKDTSRGARGHSSLRAAVDTEILIEGTAGLRTASVCKQRDLPIAGPFSFELEAVEIGRDERGDPVTACVVAHRDGAPIVERTELRGKAQRQLLMALRARLRDEPDRVWTIVELREVGRLSGQHKSTARAAVDALATSPFLTATVGGYRLSDG